MAKKVIILVRHGQYHPAGDTTLERLTTLGRKQARLVGTRLREEKILRIVHSTMPRAVETANIIKAQLKHRGVMETTDLLRECVPGFPEVLRQKHGYTKIKMAKARLQLDKAFKKYFSPPKKDSVEVLVCHGNVIRYLVCKAMGVPEEAWINMDIQQCGLSVIEINSKGFLRRQVISHNDVGHIPKKQRTFL
jgi:serine/threonine-protein phosphatase PGAM5